MTTDHVAQPTSAGKPSLNEALQTARDIYRKEVRLARGGARAAAAFTGLVDELLTRIYSDAADETDTPVALIAVGGYGRRHLCLHSDIDLLVLFDGSIDAAEERFVKSLLHPLWDLGFDVGQQVRKLSEFTRADTDNPEFLVSLADSRFLFGDNEVFRRFDTLVHSPQSVWRQPTIAALLSLLSDRHRQYNATIYQLEPDIKEAPGALRDVAAIRSLVALTQPDGTRSVPTASGRLDEALDEASGP